MKLTAILPFGLLCDSSFALRLKNHQNSLDVVLRVFQNLSRPAKIQKMINGALETFQATRNDNSLEKLAYGFAQKLMSDLPSCRILDANLRKLNCFTDQNRDGILVR